MLTVSIDYEGSVISNPKATFSSMKKAEWLQDPLVQEFLKEIDKAEVIQGFCIKDRWGNVVPPEYMSTGSKALMLMMFQDKYPVYATRCGDNCIPFIERISKDRDIHVVLHHCMHFSEGFEFFVTDVNRMVKSFRDWVNVFYAVADEM